MTATLKSCLFPAIRISGGLAFGVALGCSSSEDAPSTATGGQAGGPAASTGGTSTASGGTATASGGTSSSTANVGTFSVTLNPPPDASSPPYTSIVGKVYSGEYPSDVIETPVSTAGGCTTYKFSRHSCIDVTCTSSQVCAGPEDCREAPRLVSVGAVSLAGIGDGSLKLSAVNNNYQYPSDVPYPGFDDGATLTLTAIGDFYPAFMISTTGVTPAVLGANDYELSRGQPLLVEWEPGTNPDADVSISLNISRHGGSAGYLECETEDSGSFTIPAEPIQALIDLGVAGYPQLRFSRSTRGVTQVTGGTIRLEVSAVAIPALEVEGYCSCFDGSDCESCSDTTKSVCDPVRKLCLEP